MKNTKVTLETARTGKEAMEVLRQQLYEAAPIDTNEVAYYTEKFFRKMNGSTLETAEEWVDGAGLNPNTTKALWTSILSNPETELV